jgi:DNA-directed RNA polymerase subunit RPC12/RpoP
MSETLDLANLGTQPIDQGGQYEPPSEFFRPPEPTAKGARTKLVLAESPEDDRFYPLKDFDTKEEIPGFSVNLKFSIVGGPQDGKEFYAFISTRKFSNRNSSLVKDYLLGAGFTGQLITEADFKNAVQNFIGPVDAKIVWEGERCATCGKRTVKMADFPERENGTLNHVTACPQCGEPIGARAKVSMFFPRR